MKPVQIFEMFFISVAVSYLVTPFVRTLAMKTGYVDHPKDNKVHAHPTALLGGLAIFIGLLIAILGKEAVLFSPRINFLLIGTFILLVTGLIDDRMGMLPGFKLLGQFLAAMVIIKSGLRIEFIKNYYLSVVVTYIWIMGITNAFNLLDNMNGLSAGIAAIAASFFSFLAYKDGNLVLSALCLAIAGSCIGFLKHNFPRAGIFMGDCGSLVIGYLLSVVAIMGGWNKDGPSCLIAVLVLGYPIFDTALVSIVRVTERRSIFRGGKDHSSHRLALLGLKRFRTVLAIYGICILLGISAVAVSMSSVMIGIVTFLAALFAMVGLGIRLSLVDTKQFGRKKVISDS